MEPQIRFCTSADGTRIAYVVVGDGPGVPVVSVNSWVFNIDMIMSQAPQRAHLESLTDRRRVVTFDRRGVGASQRDPSDFSLEANVADLAAVAERLESPRVHLVGHGDGGRIAAAYAALNPQRVGRLVLFSVTGGGNGRPEGMVRLIRENWSWARRVFASVVFPNGPSELQRWLSSSLRDSMSPEVAVRAVEANEARNVTDLLRRIQAPTLVVDFRSDAQSREVAAMIPDSRFLVVPGDLASMWTGDELTRAMKEFIEESDLPAKEGQPISIMDPGQIGVTVIVFADVADSTALTESLGDAAFRGKARDLDGALRSIIREYSGTPIEGKLLGDGVLAVFTSARQAIEAALVCGRAGGGAELPLHLGLHAGDVIREENNVYGGAVNIAARISDLSAPGEVLVSDTVRSLARTSAGVSFVNRGEQTLKGMEEPVRVWAVVEGAEG